MRVAVVGVMPCYRRPWYNVRTTSPLHRGHFTDSFSVEAAHEDSHQAAPTQGSRAALPQASDRSSRTPREPHGQMGRAAGEWHLPLVYDRTAHIKTRWHPHCLNTYRVTSGQHPEEIQHTLYKVCVAPSDEIDHRLAIEVVRALGQPPCCVRSRRTICACYAGFATDAKQSKIGGWRSFCQRVLWIGILHGGCSGRIASGRCRFCCRAACSRLQVPQF